MSVTAVVTNKGKAALVDRFRVTPGVYANPMKYGAMGTGATGASHTAAVADTALQNEVDSRSIGSDSLQTTTTTNDTFQTVVTITAGGSRTVDEFGLFDSANTGQGNMGFSATFIGSTRSLSAGEALQFTATIQAT